MCTKNCASPRNSPKHKSQASRSIYARAWRFVRLHLRPRADTWPTDRRTTPIDEIQTKFTRSCYKCDWQRVQVLKELEEFGARAQWQRKQQCRARQKGIDQAEWTPTDASLFRTQAQRKTAQVMCRNCRRLFFRPLAIAADTSAFCSRDCQSTFEYRRYLQNTAKKCEP
ncbi:hypothetical protein CCR75_002616 [Bremia lactucae]|uniref:Uncharacterized protein n=1 Tax=Bremia lactucae TaxID=4779 RepID=A0A976IL01_BRELC|nr:hypothetical protein CCR75_002616 [Bremia lactucae]